MLTIESGLVIGRAHCLLKLEERRPIVLYAIQTQAESLFLFEKATSFAGRNR